MPTIYVSVKCSFVNIFFSCSTPPLKKGSVQKPGGGGGRDLLTSLQFLVNYMVRVLVEKIQTEPVCVFSVKL